MLKITHLPFAKNECFSYKNRVLMEIHEEHILYILFYMLSMEFIRKNVIICYLQDLGNADLLRDAYLVAHIYRIGSLKEGESKKTPTRQYKRPYGCAGKLLLWKFIFLCQNAKISLTLHKFHLKQFIRFESDLFLSSFYCSCMLKY